MTDRQTEGQRERREDRSNIRQSEPQRERVRDRRTERYRQTNIDAQTQIKREKQCGGKTGRRLDGLKRAERNIDMNSVCPYNDLIRQTDGCRESDTEYPMTAYWTSR